MVAMGVLGCEAVQRYVADLSMVTLHSAELILLLLQPDGRPALPNTPLQVSILT